MNLHGSIRELQNTAHKLYLELEQRFSENVLIRELWNAMADDVSQQIHSLNALPQSFWNHLKEEQAVLLAAIADSARAQHIENKDDKSLKWCFERALQVEEPTIIKVYAPLIRKLRENLTAPALDFYIIVKSHLARITRVTQSFSGDPIAIQRANALLQAFEKEVQEPHIEFKLPDKKKDRGRKPADSKAPAGKARKIKAKPRPSPKPAKILHRRAKPLVKKLSVARRRARR